jgi:shikimate kinase
MLGVQGAGKSLCAKAIATAWQRPLLRMDPGALYDRTSASRSAACATRCSRPR